MNQLKAVTKSIDSSGINVRYMCQDLNLIELVKLYPDRLFNHNTKTWKLNDCEMENEDWVLLDEK